jgi:putative flippase GtrA
MDLVGLWRRWGQSTQVRFLVAGSSAALVNWLVRFPLELIMPFAATIVVSMAIGLVSGFILYKAWVFPPTDRLLWLQIRDFLLVNVVGQIVMIGVALLLRELLVGAGVATMIAGGVAHFVGIAVGAFANYLGHRHFTFAPPPAG